jgi:hypothetical protein
MMNGVTQVEITRRFSHHSPDPKGVERMRALRNCGKLLGEMMVELCPASRELAVAVTKLEETIMWANAAIVRPAADSHDGPEPGPGPVPGHEDVPHLRRVA